MKKTVITVSLLLIGSILSSCKGSVSALANQSVLPTPSPAVREVSSKEQPPVTRLTERDLLPPIDNPNNDIGERAAVDKTLGQESRSSPRVIKTTKTTYGLIDRVQPAFSTAQPPKVLENIPVYVVEMEGNFEPKYFSNPSNVSTIGWRATKAYFVLRAADGFVMRRVFVS